MAKGIVLTQTRLRREVSQNNSGYLVNIASIPTIKERDYYVTDEDLDGDAPKKLIRVYEYQRGGKVRRDSPGSWTPYIAKSAEKWYPHESVVEYFMNRAGQVMGLVMNEVKLVRINNQVRFLSKFFLTKGEVLIHGAEICGDFVGDRKLVAEIANDKQTARQFLTFSFVSQAIRNVFPDDAESLINDLVRVLIFDALLGNNDRHFYNWGVIRPVRKGDGLPRLAPVYDSARGFFWNHSERSVVKWLQLLEQPNWRKYEKYLEGTSPRFSLESDREVNHFDFVRHLCQVEKRYLSFARELASRSVEDKIARLLSAEFGALFSPERLSLMRRYLHDRFDRIRLLTLKN